MSEVTIDKIAIEVDSSAAMSAEGLDKLAKSLSNLRSNAKLSTTVNNLTKLSSALQNMRNVSGAAQSIRSLTNAINGLNGVKDLSNFNKAINGLSKVPKALDGLKRTNLGEVGMQLSSLAQSVKPLENVGKSNLGSTLNQLKKLPEIAKGLDSKTISEFADRIEELTVALAPLASQMEHVSSGFNALPRNINKALKTLDNYNSSVGKAGKANGIFSGTLGNLRTSWLAYGYAARTVLDLLTDSFVAFTERYETMNLFSVAMGEYTDEAYDYAMKVQNALGINAAEWAKNQGTFMMLITGFGEARDTAYEMSKGLTQFAYDLSSIANMPLEEAFTKVQAGIAGEIEPLRRVGIDLSEARLQEIAYANGINQKVSAMNQASKAELRYIAITQQIPGVVGDMSRTLTSPANALRVLKSQFGLLAQTIGSLVNVVVYKFIPVMQVIVQVVIMVANAISSLLTGKTLADWDKESFKMSSNLGGAASSAGDVADSTGTAAGNLKDAADNAKKAKQYMMGWDELNVIDTTAADAAGSGGGGGGGSVGGGGGGLGLDLDSLWSDSMLAGLNSQLEETQNRVKDVLSHVAAIGAGFAAWKIAKKLIDSLDKISKFSLPKIGLNALGGLMFLADLEEFARYFRDFLDNGPTFQNVVGMLSEFSGAIGDVLILMGKHKYGAALKLVQGLGEIAVAIKDINDVGLNIDNALTLVRGLSNIAIAVGILSGNMKLIGAGLALQGLTTIIREISENWEEIKNLDFSGVDKGAVIIGVIEVIAGIATALGAFNTLKDVVSAGGASNAATAVSEAADTIGSVDDAVSNKMSPKLTSLAKNMGLGLVIIAEASAAAMLIVGAIAVLGEELQAVGDAWGPVVENGSTVLAGTVAGTAIIVAVGAATAAIGNGGTPVAANIAVGTAILLEAGAAAGLLLVEIEAIGTKLNDINTAWSPVLTNGGTVATSVAIGTGLLVGVAAAVAGIGAVTTATGFTIPVAIGVGTAALVLAAAAFVALSESIVTVADEISTNVAPAFARVNGVLPDLVTNSQSFTTAMESFSDTMASYTKSTALSGLSATLGKVVGLLTVDPIKALSDNVEDVYNQTSDLNDNLSNAIPELEEAITLLTDYKTFIETMESILASKDSTSLSGKMLVNMQDVGKNLVIGFTNGIKGQSTLLTTTGNTAADTFLKGITDKKTDAETAGKTYLSYVTQGITNNKSLITTEATNIATEFNNTFTSQDNMAEVTKIGEDLLKSIQTGISNSKEGLYKDIKDVCKKINEYFDDLVKDVKQAARDIISAANEAKAAASSVGAASSKVSSVRMRASGGTVPSGELFMARESGPELVGSIGSTTTVMNNDQIVSAVSSGVARAVASVMGGQSGGEQKVEVYLDGEKIYANQKKIARSKGREFNMGAFAR